MTIYARRKPMAPNVLYCGVFRNGVYMGSLFLTPHKRDQLHKNGMTTMFWDI